MSPHQRRPPCLGDWGLRGGALRPFLSDLTAAGQRLRGVTTCSSGHDCWDRVLVGLAADCSAT